MNLDRLKELKINEVFPGEEAKVAFSPPETIVVVGLLLSSKGNVVASIDLVYCWEDFTKERAVDYPTDHTGLYLLEIVCYHPERERVPEWGKGVYFTSEVPHKELAEPTLRFASCLLDEIGDCLEVRLREK